MAERRPPVLVLGSAELEEAISLSEIVDAVEEAYRLAGTDRLAQEPRLQVREVGAHTFMHMMGAVSEEAGFAAAHVYSAGNRETPVVQKVMLVFDMTDGALRAVIESHWLSWARTGATGAVATRHLARPDAGTLGVIGTGRQAAAQLLAIAATRRLEEAFVYSRSPERRRAFAEEMTALAGIPVTALDSGDAVAERVDILSTATTARQPVFSAAAVRPGLHINAIGAHYPDRREIDTATVARSRVFVDDPARSAEEDGELELAVAEGAIDRSFQVVPLAAVVAGRAEGRTAPDEVTLFLSGGLGSEYLGAAVVIVRRAEALGLGTRVQA